MKGKFKKIMAFFMAAVVAATALCVTVSAESIYDTAKAINSNKQVSTTLYYDEEYVDYKVTVAKRGTLNLKITAQMKELLVYVYDSDGNTVNAIDVKTTSGQLDGISKAPVQLYWNRTVEKYAGTVSYGVNKGTYYIRFKRYYSEGNGKLNFTATFPSSDSSSAKISYFSIELKKGNTIQLGGVLTDKGTITWSSSDTSVATVSSSGKVTAKGKGSAIITAKVGSSSLKLKIKVS